MDRVTCIIVCLVLANITFAQSLFIKTYDFGTVENSYQTQYYNNRIFISTATFCGTECSFLAEVDASGNILWRTEVDDIDIASGTTVIANDTITVTGNNDPLNTAFRMAHFTLDGEKVGGTIEIEHPTEKFIRMFQLTTQHFNSQYVICGSGEQGDTAWSLMYVVNKMGAIDTLIKLEPTNHLSTLWDSYIDSEGRLTTYHWIEHAFSPVNYRKVFKFDSNFDTVWTYRSENEDKNHTVPRGCELHDGRTVLSYGIYGPWQIHSVRAINEDSSISWQHDYPFSGSKERVILRLKTLNNGDIMGSGVYTELTEKPRVNGSPWLFRMSSEGQLLWERT